MLIKYIVTYILSFNINILLKVKKILMFFSDGIKSDQVLYYTVQLVDLFRLKPGAIWTEEDGLKIEVFIFLVVKLDKIYK